MLQSGMENCAQTTSVKEGTMFSTTPQALLKTLRQVNAKKEVLFFQIGYYQLKLEGG